MSRNIRFSLSGVQLDEEYELQQHDVEAGSSSESTITSQPGMSSNEPACVCSCFSTPHGPTCYVTRGGVRALVEATLGIFRDRTGRSVRTRAVVAALGATALGAAAGAITYYSLSSGSTAVDPSEAGDSSILADAAEQVSLDDIPLLTTPEPTLAPGGAPWNDQYD